MAWKQSPGFTLASELIEPDAVYCLGLTLKERHACLAPIRRVPRRWTAKNFGGIEWLTESSVDLMLPDLLPRGAREIAARSLCLWHGEASDAGL